MGLIFVMSSTSFLSFCLLKMIQVSNFGFVVAIVAYISLIQIIMSVDCKRKHNTIASEELRLLAELHSA